MYPKLWQASGLSYPRLLDSLVRLAIDRHRRKCGLERVFSPKSAWYR
jgi:D-alanine-D-alanine ligase